MTTPEKEEDSESGWILSDADDDDYCIFHNSFLNLHIILKQVYTYYTYPSQKQKPIVHSCGSSTQALH